jgi:kinesin family protein 2/24
VLHLIDLAGSERHADSANHSAERLKETKAINTSLLNLKQCIRHRLLAVKDSEGISMAEDPSGAAHSHFHIPYRTSKLTMLLKDMLDLNSTRHCKVVSLATISPTVADLSHSINTLRYIAPLRIAFHCVRDLVAANKLDPKNPRTWSNEDLREWVKATSRSRVNPDVLCPSESGHQLCQLPEGEFITRCLEGSDMLPKQARLFYLKLWGLVIDARTKRFKDRMKQKKKMIEKKSKESMDEIETILAADGLNSQNSHLSQEATDAKSSFMIRNS